MPRNFEDIYDCSKNTVKSLLMINVSFWLIFSYFFQNLISKVI